MLRVDTIEMASRSENAAGGLDRLEFIDGTETQRRLSRLIEEAAKAVFLVSPYVSLDKLRTLTRSIQVATKRGVPVTLVVRAPDKATRHSATCVATLSELVASGLKLYALQDLQSRRSEEHTSELQSLTNLVCRLLLA